MKIFVFDTETTWFMDKKNLSDLNKQPYIIQFAWILWELDENYNYKELKRVNMMIKPPISIPYNSSQIHHIYDVDVKNAPSFEEKVDEIMYYINSPDIIIWHNVEYDEDMIKLELRRLEKEYLYRPKQVICTMNETIDFCKLPKKNENSPWYKRPKLWELYKILFQEFFIWAHDAMVDVEATNKAFIELVKKWVIQLKNSNSDMVMTLF